MKIKALPKKFNLNKRTVVDLTRFEQSRIMAGDGDRCEQTWCYFSGSAVLKSSSEYFNTNTVNIGANPRYWPCYYEPPTDTFNPD